MCSAVFAAQRRARLHPCAEVWAGARLASTTNTLSTLCTNTKPSKQTYELARPAADTDAERTAAVSGAAGPT